MVTVAAPQIMFTKAIKEESFLRLAISGPSGSGKTYTSLKVATALAEAQDKRVAFLDTEHGSSKKYADQFDFDAFSLEPPFHPRRYMEAIKAAKNTHGILVLDSLSHVWTGTGGLLEIVDEAASRSKSRNAFTEGWKVATPLYNDLIDTILYTDIHLIGCMRSKQDYVLEQDDKGKMTPVKKGMAPIMRDGFEYEFDIWMEMDNSNTGIVTKSRCSAIYGKKYFQPGNDFAMAIVDWLKGAPPKKMSLEEAVRVVSPGGNTFETLTQEQLITVAKTGVGSKFTRQMVEAAEVILENNEVEWK